MKGPEGLRPRIDLQPIIPNDEAIRLLERTAPQLLEHTTIEGLNLHELLRKAHAIRNRTGLINDVVALSAHLGPSSPTSFHQIDFRYFEDVPNSAKDGYEDHIQLMLYHRVNPYDHSSGWVRPRELRELFLTWTAQPKKTMDNFYAHFIDEGVTFSNGPAGKTKSRYRFPGSLVEQATTEDGKHFYETHRRTSPAPVRADMTLQELPSGITVCSLAYEDFPREGNNGEVVVPVSLQSPRLL